MECRVSGITAEQGEGYKDKSREAARPTPAANSCGPGAEHSIIITAGAGLLTGTGSLS
ncbi:MAG: hypothetical protein HPY71_06685 [Firmicutes bacterium]|nr:hypothetical protein [Bacillota bacterium]